MYDKSKKTWSQRLGIIRSEKAQSHPNASAAIPSAASPLALRNVSEKPTASHRPPPPAAAAAALKYRSATPPPPRPPPPPLSPPLVAAPAPAMHLPATVQLQLQQQQQQFKDFHGAGYEYLPGVLTRSVKYAEPWIYGTVRGIPARPTAVYHHYQQHMAAAAAAYAMHPHAAAIFAAHPMASAAAEASAVAVVICSCPEYLSGTKRRDVKKASVCKKCKGSRLPLASIGGTVRLHNGPSGGAALLHPAQLRPIAAAATMRVVGSAKKKRPTILDPQKDPYDLMRRSRLLSPEPGGPKSLGGSGGPKESKESRGRLKTTSPVRGRARTRNQKVLNSATPSGGGEAAKSRLAVLDDCWLAEADDPKAALSSSGGGGGGGGNTRRSILRCSLNPYDLISLSSAAAAAAAPPAAASAAAGHVATSSPRRRHKLSFSQNEFMPPNDDFNVEDAALKEEAPPFATSGQSPPPPPSTSPSPSLSLAPLSTKSKSEAATTEVAHADADADADVNATANATVTGSGGKRSYSNVHAIAGQRICFGDERSLRRKALVQQSADGSSSCESPQQSRPRPDTLSVGTAASPTAEPRRPPRGKKSDVAPAEAATGDASPDQARFAAGEVTVLAVTVTPTHHIKSILKRPLSKSSDGGEATEASPPPPSPPPKAKDSHSARSTTRRSIGSSSSSLSSAVAPPSANSQFYIPLPLARKKVQFMVEERVVTIVDSEALALRQLSPAREPGAAAEADVETVETEAEAGGPEASESPTTGANRQRATVAQRSVRMTAQAALLEELQHASDRVTRAAAEAAEAGDHDLLPPATNGDGGSDYEDVFEDESTSQPPAQPDGEEKEHQRRYFAADCEPDEDDDPWQPASQSPGGQQASLSPSPPSTAPEPAAPTIVTATATAAATAADVMARDAVEDNAAPDGGDGGGGGAGDDVRVGGRVSSAAEEGHVVREAAPHQEAAMSTADDYDDDAKRQRHHHDHLHHQQQLERSKNSAQLQPLAVRDRSTSATSATPATAATKGTSAPQSRTPIRRSYSERQPSHHRLAATDARTGGRNETNDFNPDGANATNADLASFKDTMALRNRPNRSDSRDLFAVTSIGRPKEPPPPPPPPPTAPPAPPASSSSTSAPSSTSSGRSTRSHPSKASPRAPSPAAESAGGRRHLANGAAPSSGTSGTDANDKRDTRRGTAPQQAAAATITSTTTTAASAPTVASTAPAAPATGSPVLVVAGRGNQQRTVVRVAPFSQNSTEVHRLKITHDDADCSPAARTSRTQLPLGQTADGAGGNRDVGGEGCTQKTSILINGDDCYSTMNVSGDDAATPLYQSSVVVTDHSGSGSQGAESALLGGLRVTNTANTVTINVCSPRAADEHLGRQVRSSSSGGGGGGDGGRAVIPIRGTDVHLQRSASSTSSISTSSMSSTSSSVSGGLGSGPTHGRTLIRLDYDKDRPPEQTTSHTQISWLPHEEELLKILRNPVEAVKRNLVPHICGRSGSNGERDWARDRKMKDRDHDCDRDREPQPKSAASGHSPEASLLRPGRVRTAERNSFISKLLEEPTLGQVADGLETDTVAELIENSLRRLQESRSAADRAATKDSDDMGRLIRLSLQRIQEERLAGGGGANPAPAPTPAASSPPAAATKDDLDRHSNRGSISSANSFASAHNYEVFDLEANESDCYQSCSSEITSLVGEDTNSMATRSKFYQMLVDATLAEIELSSNLEELGRDGDGDEDGDEEEEDDRDDGEHQYESIRHQGGREGGDPIYEEINEAPPPLPLSSPPLSLEFDMEQEKRCARSIFEGASKYDILSYLVDAKERGLVREESFLDYSLSGSQAAIVEEEAADTLSDLGKRQPKARPDAVSSRSSVVSDSSEDNQSTMSSLSPPRACSFIGPGTKEGGGGGVGGVGAALLQCKAASSDIERNDSGVGSETSKSSRSKYQNSLAAQRGQSGALVAARGGALHLCEDCDGPVEAQLSEVGVLFVPLVCRKCGKKRVERKEIITEIVETEEKYGRDLQIILEEFCHPMLVAGLLTQEQLSAIFLNTEELLENNQTLAERMRDALDIALEQGDDDLLTVNIGKIFLDSAPMLHAFESYCVRQAGASLLLANLEKEKELLRIFLKVSQMENAVLRRMNLNSFLMVPVQRVTKYPLLLARLYKVTPAHLEGREQLRQAQEKIELHLNHINQEAKDVPTKLWRRISSSSPNRRVSCEIDMINIKLRKLAIDVLEWNHDEVRFPMEGKLLYTQPTDSNWKRARTIKLTPVNALLVTNGKPSANYKAEKALSDKVNFPKHNGVREASLLVVKEKCGRYTLIREPLYLDRCVVCSEADCEEYFEVQEISSKDTFIFKAEDSVRTKQWYTQLQFHAQGMGAWRKRRNALANIMINGMLTRS